MPLEVPDAPGLLELTDRQTLVDTLMAGLVPVAHVYMSPQDPAYGEVAGSVSGPAGADARVVRDAARNVS